MKQGQIVAVVKLSVDPKAAQDMLCCAGYGDKKRTDNELVKDLLSVLENYGVTSEIKNIEVQK